MQTIYACARQYPLSVFEKNKNSLTENFETAFIKYFPGTGAGSEKRCLHK